MRCMVCRVRRVIFYLKSESSLQMVPVVGKAILEHTLHALHGHHASNGRVATTITGAFDCYGRVGCSDGGGGTLFSALGRLCVSTMDPKPPMTMIHEEPPTDFEVAVRVAFQEGNTLLKNVGLYILGCM